jgi:integrase
LRSRHQPRYWIATKRTYVSAFFGAEEIDHLQDADAERLNRYLATLDEAQKSARTVNAARAAVVALLNWAVENDRLGGHDVNPKTVPVRDEAKDKRRPRRPLTTEELDRLLVIAGERDADLAWEGLCPASCRVPGRVVDGTPSIRVEAAGVARR